MAEKSVKIIDEDGQIAISEEVVTSIARIAAEKVDGIARSGKTVSGLKSFFGGEDTASIIKSEFSDDGVHIELTIAVEYGYPVHEVAQGVQNNVQKDVEEMAGIDVIGVDVYVRKVIPIATEKRQDISSED